MTRLLEIGGRRLPILRWSFVRMILGMKKLTTEWQVGDGREAAARDYVLEHAPAGDLDAAIAALDEFAYKEKYLINVGDEKGALLDAAISRVKPKLALELGTYCGYGSLRMARASGPEGRLVSVEFVQANAEIARAIIDHAGVADRVKVVVGTIGDGGETVSALESEHGFGPGSVDLAFLDHDKDAYLPDLESILERGWLHPGSIVVADNVKFPGAPEYHAYMEEREGREWRTTEHEAHVEYQTMIKDLVLESEYVGSAVAA
jgi:catechol O-methyltransferase